MIDEKVKSAESRIFRDVLSNVDEEMIAEAMERPRRRFPWAAAAAAAVLVLGAALLLPKLIKDPRGFLSAFVPTPLPTAETTSDPLPTQPGEAGYDDALPQWLKNEDLGVSKDHHATLGDWLVFYSFDELEEAIAASAHKDPSDPLHGLENVYIPAALPDTAKLDHIEVMKNHFLLVYTLEDRAEEEWFWFKLYRDPNADLQKYAQRLREQGDLTQYGDIYIIETEGKSPSALWKQDGLVLQIGVPYGLSSDAIAGLCRGVPLELPAPPENDPAFVFSSAKEFFDAVSSNRSMYSALDLLNGYYAFMQPPEDLPLSSVSVTHKRITLRYGGEGKDGLFLVYFRDLSPDEFNELPQVFGDGGSITKIGDFTEVLHEGGVSLFWRRNFECFGAYWEGRHELTEELAKELFRVGFVSAPEAVPSVTPLPEGQVLFYHSFEELEADPPAGLEGYYVPAKIPEGARFKHASVSGDSVILSFELEPFWDHDEGETSQFSLTWHRELLPGSAGELAQSLKDRYGGSWQEKDGVWIENLNSSVEGRVVFQSEEGAIIEILMPFENTSYESVLSYAKAVWHAWE